MFIILSFILNVFLPSSHAAEPILHLKNEMQLTDQNGVLQNFEINTLSIFSEDQIPSAIALIKKDYEELKLKNPKLEAELNLLTNETIKRVRKISADENDLDQTEEEKKFLSQIDSQSPVHVEKYNKNFVKKIGSFYSNMKKESLPKYTFAWIRPSLNATVSFFSAFLIKKVPIELCLPTALTIFMVSKYFTIISPQLRNYLNNDRLTSLIIGKKEGFIRSTLLFVEGMIRYAPIGTFFALYPAAVNEATRALHGLPSLHPEFSVTQYVAFVLNAGLYSIIGRQFWEVGYNKLLKPGWAFYTIQAIGSAITATGVTLGALGLKDVAMTAYEVQIGVGATLIFTAQSESIKGFFSSLLTRVKSCVWTFVKSDLQKNSEKPLEN